MLVCLVLTAWLLASPRSYGFPPSLDTVRIERENDETFHSINKTKAKPAVGERERYAHGRQQAILHSKNSVKSEEDDTSGSENMNRLSRDAKGYDFDNIAIIDYHNSPGERERYAHDRQQESESEKLNWEKFLLGTFDRNVKTEIKAVTTTTTTTTTRTRVQQTAIPSPGELKCHQSQVH